MTPVCETECTQQCAQAGDAYSPAAAPQPAAPEVAPPPPSEPKAQVYKGDSGMHTVSAKRSLKNVFGLLR